MHIARIQVEEGFLDGLSLDLVPGLNVIIGSRGTGKTSLIELVRFCLDVQGYTPESSKRSREHALSVLGPGQITVTLKDGARAVEVSRSASDSQPRSSGPFSLPIILSQTEIESVGLQPVGRMRLVDGFLPAGRRRPDSEDATLVAEVRSLTAEIDSLGKEVADLSRQVAEIPSLCDQLKLLLPEEQKVARLSEETSVKRKQLEEFSARQTAVAVSDSTIALFQQTIVRGSAALKSALGSLGQTDAWPSNAGEDRLHDARTALDEARILVEKAALAMRKADTAASDAATAVRTSRLQIEEQARQLRKEFDGLQEGAGAIVRQTQKLRERIAQLESAKATLEGRQRRVTEVMAKRESALDQLDSIREERFNARADVAKQLNTALGRLIRVDMTQASQFEQYTAVIAETLRGSGLRYVDLSARLASRLSPRELLGLVDGNDIDRLSDVADIAKDRAARVMGHLRDSDLGELATARVDDGVNLRLLDGADYKDVSELSVGQRCTVVLPLVMRHTEAVLIVDQPEDHLDNAFIVETLLRSVLNRDPAGQILFSTHNANIPVLGEANRVVQLASDGKRGFVATCAGLEDGKVVEVITSIMEGGAEAFSKRAKFYQRKIRT